MSTEITALLARQDRLRAVAERLRSRPRRRPRQVLRRIDALLEACDLFCPELVQHSLVLTFHALAEQRWLRPLHAWSGEGGLAGLYRHLLVAARYPMPGFLFRPLDEVRLWWVRQSPAHNVQLLAHLGQGGSARAAVKAGLLPASMTRRMQHVLLTLQEPMPLPLAVRVAQLQVMGAAPWLARALQPTRLGAIGAAAQEQQRAPMLDWLARRSGELPQERVRGVVDWLLAKPEAELKGALRLGASRALAEAQAFHTPQRWRAALPMGPLPVSALQDMSLRLKEARWEVRQLRQAAQLVDEGRALEHCVATYHRAVMQGTSEIFGLLQDGERRLTVEVRPAQGAIVQARGLRNRRPKALEREVLQRWAQANQLRLQSV